MALADSLRGRRGRALSVLRQRGLPDVEPAVGADENHLWDVAFELRPVRWWDWFPTGGMRRIQERVEDLPMDVVPHGKGG